jgi:Na+/pantothenate symporter
VLVKKKTNGLFIAGSRLFTASLDVAQALTVMTVMTDVVRVVTWLGSRNVRCRSFNDVIRSVVILSGVVVLLGDVT